MNEIQHNDEISLKDIVLKVVYLVKLIKKNIIVFSLIVLGCLVLSYFIPSHVKYSSKSTLMFNTGGSNNKLLSLASNFGFGGSDNVVSFEKYKNIATSKMLLDKIFYKSVEINGKIDLLGHHIIDNFGWRKDWKETRPSLANIDLNRRDAKTDTVLSYMYGPVLGQLDISQDDGDLVIVSFTSENENIALEFNKFLVKECIDFFYESYLDKDIQTRNIIKSRLDSIKRDLNSADFKYSNLKDKSYKTVKAIGYIDILRAERELRILTEMLVEAKKQFEIINFKVLNANDSIQKIDAPIYPLPFSVISLSLKLFIGFSAGLFFASLFILIKDFYNNSLENLKQLIK